MNPKIIVIAGASGFVGRALCEKLLIDFPEATIIALSRSAKSSTHPRVVWKQCDLFSEDSIAEALPETVDLVYYLVHSMEPTAQFDQGSFADYDLIMSDNFARACRTRSVKQLVYLGGLIPEGADLSLHLRSRLEVETVFEEHKIPHTFLRAGLIIGEGGSSFEILLKLVSRLHIMICPAWTQTRTTPVSLPEVIRALVQVAAESQHLGRTYDLAGCQPLTYTEMMRLTAQHMGLKRYFIKVPLFSPTLSRLWVSLITNTSKYLVYPLIESLEHPMVARESNHLDPNYKLKTYSDMIKGVSTHFQSKPFRFRWRIPGKTVRSVQRIAVTNRRADEISEMYFQWLPKLTLGLIAVRRIDKCIQLRLLSRITLIELREVADANQVERVTYMIHRGVLVRRSRTARLEFRLVLRRQFVVIAIHDYAPALPWFIYRFTQAVAHLLVMQAFRRYLSRMN